MRSSAFSFTAILACYLLHLRSTFCVDIVNRSGLLLLYIFYHFFNLGLKFIMLATNASDSKPRALKHYHFRHGLDLKNYCPKYTEAIRAVICFTGSDRCHVCSSFTQDQID